MVILKLRVVPADLDVGGTVVLGHVAPLIRGSGTETLACGACAATLLSGVDSDRVAGWVFRCPECGAHNSA